MTAIVAFTGLATSGKSTAARILAQDLGYTRIRFADPLKNMLRAIGLGEEEIEGRLKERPCALLQGKTCRYAMQTLGTEWGRDLIGPAFWTGLWQAKALDVVDLGGRVAVEDCRFPNEADVIRRSGGIIIRIDRPGLSVSSAPRSFWRRKPRQHPSEALFESLPYDFRINNDGSLEDLEDRLMEIL